MEDIVDTLDAKIDSPLRCKNSFRDRFHWLYT